MNTTKTNMRGARRTLAVTAAGALALALTPAQAFAAHGEICPPPGESGTDHFSDDEGSVHEGNINCLVSYDIASGFADGTYGPGQDVDRAQMATFIANYIETATGQTLDEGPDAFTDDEGSVHETNINKLANADIVGGFGDGTYRPGQDVNRAQMATFIAAGTEFVLGAQLPAGSDAFADDEGSVHESNIDKLAAAGIVEGQSETQFNPNNDVTRAQMASFVINGAAHLYTEDAWAPVPLAQQGQATANAVTDQPELLNVEVVEQDDTTTQLRFTFDEAVAGQTPAAANFHLYTAEGTAADGQSAFIDSGQDDSVLVTFDVNATAWADYSLATVDFDAVEDTEANANPEGAFGLQSVTSPGGTTVEPDLVEIGAFDATTNEVEFVFDEEVDVVNDATGFQLVETDGDLRESTGAVIDPDQPTVVRVQFADIDTTTEGQTARAVVQANAVDDGDPNDLDAGTAEEAGNPLQIVELTAGGDTDEPDLVSITLDEANEQAQFTFDEAVELSSTGPLGTLDPTTVSALFAIYDRTGAEIEGTNATRSSSDNTTVVVEFTGDDLQEAVGANVEAGAVTGTTGTTGRTNDADELPTEGTEVEIATTFAPDLLETRVEANPDATADLRVAYDFDEEITGTPVAANFYLYDLDGERTAGTNATVDSTDSSIVYVTFGATGNDQQIQDALLATVDNDAVTDESGTGNPEGARNLS